MEFAPEVDQENPHMRRLIKAIGRVMLEDDDFDAWVSTESTVSDFMSFTRDRKDDEQRCGELTQELGVKVTPRSYLWELAAQMEANA